MLDLLVMRVAITPSYTPKYPSWGGEKGPYKMVFRVYFFVNMILRHKLRGSIKNNFNL